MTKLLEGNPVKKAYASTKYTEEMLEELDMCMPEINPDAHHYFMTKFGHLRHPTKGMTLYEPYDYQLDLIDNFHNYTYNINMLGRQMGKALSADTPIPTPNGIVTMGDISIGDYVYDENHNVTKVINKTLEQLDRVCYAIKFSKGIGVSEVIVADASHEWLVSHNEVIKIVTTEELLGIYQDVVLNTSERTFRIVSIENTPSVSVYCIEVENPRHLFLVGENYIPTHNCVVGESIITLRNKNSGEIVEMSISEFHEIVKHS